MRFLAETFSEDGGAFPFSADDRRQDGEEIQYETHRHWATSLLFLALSLLLSRPTCGLSLFCLLLPIYQIKTYHYAITNRRILARQDLFHRRTIDIPLEQRREIEIHQGAIGSLLGMGNITIHTDNARYCFKSVADPRAFQFYCKRAGQVLRKNGRKPFHQA